MTGRVKKKLEDTSEAISEGGRFRKYWAGKEVKNRRSFFVSYENGLDMQAILKEYSLKGFEFGNWLNANDRYDFMIGAEQSLKDLARIMHTKNLGMDHLVGIAFGARGMGGKVRAHYEPELNMINLTKTKGEGSLAHEYGHALDFNLGTFIDQNRNYRALSGGRSMAKMPENNTGGTCRMMMRDLIYSIKQTDSFERLKEASDYWHFNTEVFARFFEQWCCYKLRELHTSNAFLTKAWTFYVNRPQYLTEADFKKVLPLSDRLMKNIALTLNGKATEKYNPMDIKENEKATKEPVKKAASR